MQSLSNTLIKISPGWVTLIGFVAFVLFSALVLPQQSSKADEGIEDAGSPDLSIYYSTDQLYDMADAYGESGRADYIRARFSFDIIWPLVYGVFLVTSISWFFSRGFKKSSVLQNANLVPVFGVLFDFLENVSTSLVMYRYPAKTLVVDTLAPVFTTVKWFLVGGSFILLMLGFSGWIISTFRKTK